LEQERAEVQEDLSQKMSEIVEMHKEVEEKSEELAEKAKEIDTLLIQIQLYESTRFFYR
jgi:methyl-accepting chemotaxis protein